jgi:parallel beta-helix repeat protein
VGRRLRYLILAAALAAGLLAGEAPAGAAPVACGTTITVSTTLTADMTCPGDAIVIRGPNVVLDLGGHLLTGAGFEAGGAGVRVEAPGATVRNGRVERFRFGVHLSAGSNGALIDGLRLTGNIDGAFVASSANRFRGNTFVGNSGAMLIAGAGNTVEGNNYLDNDGGILVSGPGNAIVANGMRGAGGDDSGIVAFGAGTRIVSNSVSGYGGYSGIGMSATGEVTGNQVFSSVNGIYVAGAASISGNVVFSNADDGIEVAPGAGATLRANIAVGNADLGIDAGAGAIDAGGNRAFANGNPRQCVGVVCS